jgi:hypothetical protein
MFDRIFSAALAFCVLAGGTLAVGTAMLEQPEHVVMLPRVEITAKRALLNTPAQVAQAAGSEPAATVQ